MRKYNVLRNWALPLLLSAFLYGCAEDNTDGGAGMVDLKLALNTYAAGDDPNALANEVADRRGSIFSTNTGRSKIPAEPLSCRRLRALLPTGAAG